VKIKKEPEFDLWFAKLTKKQQSIIAGRLDRIENHSHFGDTDNLGNGLCELRWRNGWRIYFILDAQGNVVLVLGGNKNEQKKNIKKARILISRYTPL
jgi:putative addiction module killer protein